MRVKSFFLFICILTTVMCEVENDEIQKLRTRDERQREKTTIAEKYDPGFGENEKKVDLVDTSGETRRGNKYGLKNDATSFDGICQSADVRNSIENLNKIEDCVVIEGFLRIIEINSVDDNAFENITFPKLREITGFLLLHKINGLKSLTNLFPNLEIIRGQNLLNNYALMVYEMPNLQELGLTKLIKITTGGVRIEKNPILCYVNTINWNLIVHTGDISIKYNKNESSCPGCSQCNPSHCWTAKDCQVTYKSQCNSQCLGSCIGPKDTDCNACKHFRHDGRCVAECPKNLYGFLSRRCISREECLTMKLPGPPNAYGLIDVTIWRTFNDSCINQCPTGFEDYVDPNNGMTCRECSGPCNRIIKSMRDPELYGEIDFDQNESRVQNKNRNFPSDLVESLVLNAEEAAHSANGSPNVDAKTSRQSTSKNLPTSNSKPEDRKRGHNSTKSVIVSADGICPSTDIRNSVANFAKIQHCIIIEGFLQIVLTDRTNEAAFENITLPNLREITGYLLLFRVNGLKSLRKIFPNLEVIRGQSLLTDYALMVYEMPNLQELGLKKLVEITRGGVRIEKNPTLCYVDTVNWTQIVGSGADIFVKYNKPQRSCPGCSQCNSTVHCWTSRDCQVTAKNDCHSECLGWCEGLKDTDCYVCKHFRHNGRCVAECPKHLYGYLSRRCITHQECLTMKIPSTTNLDSPLAMIWRPFNGSCLTQCPTGYEDYIDPENVAHCRKCTGPCRRVLRGEPIRNMADAQRYRGMNVIQGGLEFHIGNANRNIMNELIESFGEIEEITGYLKVMHSFPITSLAFFKKLKVIGGEPPDNNNSSLTMLDNPNLSNLFGKDQKIEIQKGRLFFHYNPKLCFSKIEELGHMTGIQNLSKAEVDPESNGEKVACNIRDINIEISESGPNFFTIAWNNYVPSDGQRLLGYILNYMATENENVTIFDSNFCGNNTWQSVDVDIPDSQLTSSTISKTITGLKPYTSYAIYVKTYVSRNEQTLASPVGQSEINFFRTQSDIPSSPTNLSSFPESDTTIRVSWGPPDQPNGPIGYYLISGFIRKDDPDFLVTRDYCKYGLIDETSDQTTYLDTTEKVVADIQPESCCETNLFSTKPKAPQKFELMCHENMSISLLLPGEKSYCGSSGMSYLQSLTTHGVNEVFLANVSAQENSYLVKNLTHYSAYTISVGACSPKLLNGTEQCSEIRYTTTKTSKRESADDVHNLEATVSNDTIVTLSWDPIDNPNGLTVSYTIEYTNLDVKDAKNSIECVPEIKIRERGNKFDLNGLSPGKYTVRVRSTSLAGDGRFSNSAKFVVQVHESSSVWVRIGIGFALVAVALILVSCLMYKRRQDRKKQIRLIASVNPDYIETKYIIDDWEVPREDVQILEELGLGNFGMVYRGILNGGKNVAIKTISENANLREKNEFLNEASVMKNFATFHIIKLLGVVSIGAPPFVIMELMENGDLKTYLRKIRDTHLVPNFSRICRMAAEIADGMAYLESKKFVHRDLAARNCMVSKDLVCKIGDFGMARDIYETDYYKIGKKGLLPIRWMAPENLSDGVFTSDSDVWSYGVVLYEILTLAEIPYQGFSNEEVLNYVLRKGTVDIPKNCPEIIFKLMERCFKWRPNDRPTFLEIVSELEPFLSQDFCTASFYHSSEGVEIRNSGIKKVYHNAAPIRFYFGNETARWVKDFEDNVMLLDQTKAGSSRGRIFKNGFQQFGNLTAMEDVSLDR